MSKKIFWSVIIILVLIVATLFFVFWPKSEVINPSPAVNIAFPPAKICDPYSNLDTIVKTGDVKSCVCLTGTKQKSQCQSSIENATAYTKAITQSSAVACDKITAPEMKTACVNIVKSRSTAELQAQKDRNQALLVATTSSPIK